MDAGQIYDFLFNSYAGVGILMGAFFLIMLLAAMVLERKTRRTFVDRGERTEVPLVDDEDDTAC